MGMHRSLDISKRQAMLECTTAFFGAPLKYIKIIWEFNIGMSNTCFFLEKCAFFGGKKDVRCVQQRTTLF